MPDVDIGGASGLTRTTRADRKVRNRSPTSVATPTVALAPRQIRRDAARARPTGLLPHRAQRINADSARDHDPRSARLASPASRRAAGRPIRSPMRSSSPIAVTAATMPSARHRGSVHSPRGHWGFLGTCGRRSAVAVARFHAKTRIRRFDCATCSARLQPALKHGDTPRGYRSIRRHRLEMSA